MGREIERKFTVDCNAIPYDLSVCLCHEIEQGYLCATGYAIRVRRDGDQYYMTYKSRADADSHGMTCEEYNLPLDRESYEHLLDKADGIIIYKKRYILPLNDDAFSTEYLSKRPDIKDTTDNGGIRIELDVFEQEYQGRIVAEVEFPDEDVAAAYRPAAWFGHEVTGDPAYSNARMSRGKKEELHG